VRLKATPQQDLLSSSHVADAILALEFLVEVVGNQASRSNLTESIAKPGHTLQGRPSGWPPAVERARA
jgi:hypothetical protein